MPNIHVGRDFKAQVTKNLVVSSTICVIASIARNIFQGYRGAFSYFMSFIHTAHPIQFEQKENAQNLELRWCNNIHYFIDTVVDKKTGHNL